MPEMLIRPTMKFIKTGYVVALLVAIAASVAAIVLPLPPWIPSEVRPWVPVLPAFLLLWPLKRHLQRSLTKILILEDKLRYEYGLLNKTVRTIPIAKVQDVTVRQRLSQRIFGVGDLSIESAGQGSRLTIANIDGPQQIADHINNLALKASSKGQET